MKINKITIEGFKNINAIQIELQQLTAFIAPNNYGKTNIMQAIDFGFLFIQSTSQNRKNLLETVNGAPQNEDFFSKDYLLVIEGEYNNQNYIRFKYSIGFSWTSKLIKVEKLELLYKNSKNQYKTIFDRKNDNTYEYLSKISSNNKFHTTIESNELFINKIREDEVDYYDIVSYVKNSKFLYCSQIDVTSYYSQATVITPDVNFFENIPKKIAIMAEQNKEKYKYFVFILKQLFPNFVDILINKIQLPIDHITKTQLNKINKKNNVVCEEYQYMLRIKTSKLINPLDVNEMSNGFKRVIWLLLNILEAKTNNVKIIAIEELETGIHQKLLRDLLDNIYEWIDNDLLILISTHSSELVSYLKREQIIIGIPNNDMEAKFTQLSERAYKIISKDAQSNHIDKATYIFEILNNWQGSTDLSDYLRIQ